MGWLIFALVVAVLIAWFVLAIMSKNKAREGMSVVSRRSLEQTKAAVASCFTTGLSKALWTPCDGRGMMNYRRRAVGPDMGNGAVVSIDFEPTQQGKSVEVHAWMSEWISRFGTANFSNDCNSRIKAIVKAVSEMG